MFYAINQNGRWIAAQIEYNTVDWTNLNEVVAAFASRLDEWYIKPAEILQAQPDSGHLAFPVMALNCILLDALSQFVKGTGKANFKAFVGERIPEFRANMPLTIQHRDAQTPAGVTLTTYADALYHAFRCGILHEAHVAAYGLVRGAANIVEQIPAGFTTYAAGGDCPTVVIDPWKLLVKVKEVVAWYIASLKDPNLANDALRQSFKQRFADSFGVDITTAT
jgi:hypothetical protein